MSGPNRAVGALTTMATGVGLGLGIAHVADLPALPSSMASLTTAAAFTSHSGLLTAAGVSGSLGVIGLGMGAASGAWKGIATAGGAIAGCILGIAAANQLHATGVMGIASLTGAVVCAAIARSCTSRQ